MTSPDPDLDVRTHISALIAEEHRLRHAVSDGSISPGDEERRLSDIEVQLDQAWDLLRQRMARRQYGENPDEAAQRDAATVEGYLD